MRRHTLTRVLPYSPDQLFEMVGDVARYPEFVPWLTSMRTWNARTVTDGVTVVDAEAGVGFAFLKERFATRVVRNANLKEVDVSLLYGPFRRLNNRWRFSPHPTGAMIEFDIDFEFKSKILDALLAANMDRAIAKLIGCFEARAARLYTPPVALGSAG